MNGEPQQVQVVAPGPLPTTVAVNSHRAPDGGVIVELVVFTPAGQCHAFMPPEMARNVADELKFYASGLQRP